MCENIISAADHERTPNHQHGQLAKAKAYADIVKTGRTHLMDAMPLTLGQELGAWRTQVEDSITRIRSCRPRLHCLALGGTAVGTGVNAPAGFAELAPAW